jgi:hypothetical protein
LPKPGEVSLRAKFAERPPQSRGAGLSPPLSQGIARKSVITLRSIGGGRRCSDEAFREPHDLLPRVAIDAVILVLNATPAPPQVKLGERVTILDRTCLENLWWPDLP